MSRRNSRGRWYSGEPEGGGGAGGVGDLPYAFFELLVGGSGIGDEGEVVGVEGQGIDLEGILVDPVEDVECDAGVLPGLGDGGLGWETRSLKRANILGMSGSLGSVWE